MSMHRCLFVIALFFPLVTWSWGDPTVPVEGTKYEAKLSLYVKEDVKRGTVLVLNGCNGPRAMHYYEWAKYLNEIGYNAIVVNSFDTRGLNNICPVRGNSSYSYDSFPDAVSVAHWVRKQEWSNGKVDAIGFSLGGITTLLLASHEPTEAYKKAFDGVIAYYPTCREAIQTRKVAIPLQVHIGLIDEWASADRCKALQNTDGFKDAEFNYYENTHHQFDGRSSGSSICYKGVPCYYGANKEANELSRERVKGFFAKTLD
jgi:dienelactone hydrolase